jgi:flagellar basal body rod protein FlgC
MAERTRGHRSRPGSRPSTATGTGLAPQQPQAGYVTEARLEAALARVGAQIKTNSDAIQAVNSRANTISDNVAAQTTALKKEMEERKKDTATLKKQIQDESRKARELSILPLLLQRQPQVTLQTAGPTTQALDGIPAGTKVVTDVKLQQSSDNLLPLILMMGGSTGSDSSSTSDNSLLLLALMFSQRP